MESLNAEEKLLCQFCAVLGKEFCRQELFATFEPCTQRELVEADFNKLVNKSSPVFVPHSSANGKNQRYQFLDEALHDALHDSIASDVRKKWHLDVARYLESKNENYLLVVFDALARHYYLAEEYRTGGANCKTVEYLELSGLEALSEHRMSFAKETFERLLSLCSEEWFNGIDPCTRAHWCFASCRALSGLGTYDVGGRRALDALKLLELDPAPVTLPFKPIKLCWEPSMVELVTCPSMHNIGKLSGQEQTLSRLLLATKTYNMLSSFYTDVTEQFGMTIRVNAVEVGKAGVAKATSSRLGFSEHCLVSECHTASATALVNCALFYYATGSKKLRREAADLVNQANRSGNLASICEDHVTLALKLSEYRLMKGEAEATLTEIVRALWACKFSSLSTIVVDGIRLGMAANLFLGRLTVAKTMPASYVREDKCHHLRCLQIMCSCIAGDFNVAESSLERVAKLEPGTFSRKRTEVVTFLEKDKSPALQVALALLMQRRYEERDVAMGLALSACKQLEQFDFCGLPLTSFHVLYFAVYALLESVRTDSLIKCKPSQVRPDTGEPELQADVLRTTLNPLLSILRRYANTFNICRPQVSP